VAFSNKPNQMYVFSWSIRCCVIRQGPSTRPLLIVPGQYRRARNSLFCFYIVHIHLESLALESLAAKRTSKLFDALHYLLKFRSWENFFIGTDYDQRTFQISFTPLKQLGSSQSMLASHQRYRASLLIGLIDDFKLLLRGPALAALNTGNHFYSVSSY
jgi:hypothetical protein